MRKFGLDAADRGRPLLFQLLEPRPRAPAESPGAAELRRSRATSSRQSLPEAFGDEDDNDIFLKESSALELSVESLIDEQFDYAEDAEPAV